MAHFGRIFGIVSNVIIKVLPKQSNLIWLSCLIYLRGEMNQKDTFISVQITLMKPQFRVLRLKNTYLSTFSNRIHCLPLRVPKGFAESTCVANKTPLPSSHPQQHEMTQCTVCVCLPVSRPFSNSSYLLATLPSLGKSSSVRWNITS